MPLIIKINVGTPCEKVRGIFDTNFLSFRFVANFKFNIDYAKFHHSNLRSRLFSILLTRLLLMMVTRYLALLISSLDLLTRFIL